MNVLLPCECGNRVAVTEMDAGLRVACPCGRQIDVPSLGVLRRMGGGQSTVSPRLLVEALVANGEVPATDDCAGCGAQTLRTVDVWLFEAEVEESRNRSAQVAAVLAFGLVGALVAFGSRQRRVYQDGRELRMPLRLCECCHRTRLRRLPAWPFWCLSALTIAGGVMGVVVFREMLFAPAAVVAAIAVVNVGAAWSRHRRLGEIRRLLRAEPAYREVLARFPAADLQVAERESRAAV